MMKLRKSTSIAALAAILCANLGTIAWATCWYAPFGAGTRSGCNYSGTYFYWAPDPITNCGWNGNPFQGCTESTASEMRRDQAWSNAQCTLLPILADTGWFYTGNTVSNDYAHSCYGGWRRARYVHSSV